MSRYFTTHVRAEQRRLDQPVPNRAISSTDIMNIGGRTTALGSLPSSTSAPTCAWAGRCRTGGAHARRRLDPVVEPAGFREIVGLHGAIEPGLKFRHDPPAADSMASLPCTSARQPRAVCGLHAIRTHARRRSSDPVADGAGWRRVRAQGRRHHSPAAQLARPYTPARVATRILKVNVPQVARVRKALKWTSCDPWPLNSQSVSCC